MCIWVILVLSAWSAPAPAQPNVLLLDYTNTWRFHTNNVSPGFTPEDAWTSPEFDDSQWPAGQGLFGYESSPAEYAPFAPFNTYIPIPFAGSPEFFGPISTYFRTHFSWDFPPLNVVLNFTNAVDDGIIVYLNGVELYSYNVPAGRPLPWNLLSLPGGATPLGEGVPVITNLLAPSLVMGDNVLAVGLYQNFLTTSDDVFGMKLTAVLAQPPVNLDPTQPSDQIAFPFSPVRLTAAVTGSPPPTYQWYEQGGLIPGATEATYSFTHTNPCAALFPRTYYCVVSNQLGTLQTRTATVQFIHDDIFLEITRVLSSGNLSNVVVEFSSLPEKTGAEEPFNYAIQATNGDVILAESATQVSDGRSVVVKLHLPLTPGAPYLLLPPWDIVDWCGRGLPARPTSFVAWTRNACRGVTFEAYFPPPGSPTDYPPGQEPWRPLFPDHPSEVLRLVHSFDSLEAYAPEQHSRYGARMRGIFVPPVSGGWRLFLRSDGRSQLWFNQTGPGANGRSQVAAEAGCCGPFQEPPLPQTSARLELVAGRAYYLEADWSVGIGGGYCQVAARLEGDPTLAVDLLPIPIEWLGAATLPGVAGSLAITRQPAGVSIGPGETATLSVGVNTDVPVCYQWLWDDVEIPGAIRPEYQYTAALIGLPIRFNVRVTLLGAEPVLSEPAWVTTAIHGDGPWAVFAKAAGNGTNVTVSWRSEDNLLDPLSAENPAHYLIDGVPAASARLADQTNVVLGLAGPLSICQPHTVTIRDVTDVSANLLFPNPTVLPFQAALLLVRQGPPQLWSYEDGEANLGTAWHATNYDDSGWKTGPGVLAWEPEDNLPAGWPVGTTLTQFTNHSSRPTIYFRAHFQLPTHPSTVTALRWREVVDDGCAVYLNGERVHLNRMVDPFDAQSLSRGGALEPHVVEGPFDLPARALRSGDNVLAVEVHQSTSASVDVVFGGELIADVSQCGIGLEVVRLAAGEARLDWPDPTYHLQSAPALNGPWTTDPDATSGVHVRIDTGNRYFRLAK